MILAHNHSKRGQELSGTLETILNILLTHNHPKRGPRAQWYNRKYTKIIFIGKRL